MAISEDGGSSEQMLPSATHSKVKKPKTSMLSSAPPLLPSSGVVPIPTFTTVTKKQFASVLQIPPSPPPCFSPPPALLTYDQLCEALANSVDLDDGVSSLQCVPMQIDDDVFLKGAPSVGDFFQDWQENLF